VFLFLPSILRWLQFYSTLRSIRVRLRYHALTLKERSSPNIQNLKLVAFRIENYCKLLSGGVIREEHLDWRSCPGEEVEGVSLAHPFSLRSAAGTPQARVIPQLFVCVCVFISSFWAVLLTSLRSVIFGLFLFPKYIYTVRHLDFEVVFRIRICSDPYNLSGFAPECSRIRIGKLL
jgi:hypothetical protein